MTDRPEPTGIDFIDNPYVFNLKPEQKNHWSTAGVVFAVLVWPLGLVLCVIGLVKSNKRSDVGERRALAGLVICALLAAGTFLYLALPGRPDYSTDPGCIAAAPTLNGLAATLNAGTTQALGTPGQSRAILTGIESDDDVFQTAATQAVDANLKTDLTRAANDAALYAIALEGAQAGDKSAQENVRYSYTALIFSVTLLDQVCHIAG